MRCRCGKTVIMPANGTGSPLRLQDVTLSGGLKWERHGLNNCESHWSIEVSR